MFLVVSTGAIDYLERLVSEMTYYVSSGTLNPTHSLTHLDRSAVQSFFHSQTEFGCCIEDQTCTACLPLKILFNKKITTRAVACSKREFGFVFFNRLHVCCFSAQMGQRRDFGQRETSRWHRQLFKCVCVRLYCDTFQRSLSWHRQLAG